jgi:hypothetical protein
MAPKKTQHFQMRTTEEFLAMVDNWRVRHRPVLSRAEAIHRLVTGAIKAEASSARLPKSPKCHGD